MKYALVFFFKKKLGLNQLVAVHHVKLGFSMKIASISDPPLDGETVAAISVVHRLGRWRRQVCGVKLQRAGVKLRDDVTREKRKGKVFRRSCHSTKINKSNVTLVLANLNGWEKSHLCLSFKMSIANCVLFICTNVDSKFWNFLL